MVSSHFCMLRCIVKGKFCSILEPTSLLLNFCCSIIYKETKPEEGADGYRQSVVWKLMLDCSSRLFCLRVLCLCFHAFINLLWAISTSAVILHVSWFHRYLLCLLLAWDIILNIWFGESLEIYSFWISLCIY